MEAQKIRGRLIQVRIHLDESTSLFKTLKKKKLFDKDTTILFIWLKYKPNIGELVEINYSSIEVSTYQHPHDELRKFLYRRRKPITLRIDDLIQSYSPGKLYDEEYDGKEKVKTNETGISCIHLKAHEETENWSERWAYGGIDKK